MASPSWFEQIQQLSDKYIEAQKRNPFAPRPDALFGDVDPKVIQTREYLNAIADRALRRFEIPQVIQAEGLNAARLGKMLP